MGDIEEMTRKPFPRTRQKYACGPAAGRFCLKHFLDLDIPEVRLVREMKTNTKNGYSTLPRNLMKCLRMYGLTVTPRRGMSIRSLQNNLAKGRLVICPFWDHYHVALYIEGDDIMFYESINGRLKMSLSEFERRWIDKTEDLDVLDSYGIVVTK
jgi:hypothetical protein